MKDFLKRFAAGATIGMLIAAASWAFEHIQPFL
jgi:hypothetical protein